MYDSNKSFIKKDKEPERLLLPDDLFPIVIIGKRKFYWTIWGELQCCMCLNTMPINAESREDAKDGVRRLFTLDECACTRENDL